MYARKSSSGRREAPCSGGQLTPESAMHASNCSPKAQMPRTSPIELDRHRLRRRSCASQHRSIHDRSSLPWGPSKAWLPVVPAQQPLSRARSLRSSIISCRHLASRFFPPARAPKSGVFPDRGACRVAALNVSGAPRPWLPSRLAVDPSNPQPPKLFEPRAPHNASAPRDDPRSRSAAPAVAWSVLCGGHLASPFFSWLTLTPPRPLITQPHHRQAGSQQQQAPTRALKQERHSSLLPGRVFSPVTTSGWARRSC